MPCLHLSYMLMIYAGRCIHIDHFFFIFTTRNRKTMNHRREIIICLGSSCFSRGNKDVVMFIKDYLRKNHLDDKVIFKGARCMGHCSNGPNLIINGNTIEGVTITRIESILEKEFSRFIQRESI